MRFDNVFLLQAVQSRFQLVVFKTATSESHKGVICTTKLRRSSACIFISYFK